MKLAASILAVASLLTFSIPVAGAQSSTAPTKTMHTYRLTYTLTEMDGGRKIGVQRYSMTADPQTHGATIKLMSKVPFLVAPAVANQPAQYTYFEVGLTIFSTLTSYENGIQVETMFDKTDIAEVPNSPAGTQPIIREVTLNNNTAMLLPGKSVQLGSVDVPGSTHHYDVELALEQVY
jgi:hypothetical protein